MEYMFCGFSGYCPHFMEIDLTDWKEKFLPTDGGAGEVSLMSVES